MSKSLLLAALLVEVLYQVVPEMGFAKENVLAQTLLMSQGVGARLEITSWMYWGSLAFKFSAIGFLLAARIAVGRVLFCLYVACSLLILWLGGLSMTAPSLGVVGMLASMLDGAVLYACFTASGHASPNARITT